MYVLDMCGYKKWVLQPQFTYRQPPQAHSAHSNMGGSEALTIKGGLNITKLLTNITELLTNTIRSPSYPRAERRACTSRPTLQVVPLWYI